MEHECLRRCGCETRSKGHRGRIRLVVDWLREPRRCSYTAGRFLGPSRLVRLSFRGGVAPDLSNGGVGSGALGIELVSRISSGNACRDAQDKVCLNLNRKEGGECVLHIGMRSSVTVVFIACVLLSAASAQVARKTGTTRINPKDGLTYVWIPPGTFTMGCSPGDSECDDDEKPAHRVT